jgi:hypothetical protein
LTVAAVLLISVVTVTPLRSLGAYAQSGIIKAFHNVEAGLTDQQRESIHQAAHERNNAYLHAFVSQHRDPRALPPIWTQTYAPPPSTLAAAARSAQIIVYGRVQSITFAVNPSGGMPIAISQIRVERAIKGEASRVMRVTQFGGPVAYGSGGALAEMENNELILSGDNVVLLLQRSSNSDSWQTMAGGVYFVRDGIMTSQSSEYYHVSGVPVEHFIHQLSTTP